MVNVTIDRVYFLPFLLTNIKRQMIRNRKRIKFKKYCNNQCQLQNIQQTIIAHQCPSCRVKCVMPQCYERMVNEWQKWIRSWRCLKYEMPQLWFYYIYLLEIYVLDSIKWTKVSCAAAVRRAQLFVHSNETNFLVFSISFICLTSFSFVLHHKLLRNVKHYRARQCWHWRKL